VSNLDRLGDSISVPITTDQDGYLGRECPRSDCRGYFKITPGTGLPGHPPCHCAYCGHVGGHYEFFTRAQVEYAKSVALNRITGAFLKDLKRMEFETKPRGPFGIGLSLKVSGRSHPIHYYREEELETEVVCDQCGLRYAIYGVFAHCPDCGIHNSLQILTKNLELVRQMLDLSARTDESVSGAIVANALEDAVAAFDGFGREACRIHSEQAANPTEVARLSFQNLAGARQRVAKQFDIDIASGVDPDQWALCLQCFQKRHLLAHKMGVVDDEYVRATADPTAVVGRKIRIDRDEAQALTHALARIGTFLRQQLNRQGTV